MRQMWDRIVRCISGADQFDELGERLTSLNAQAGRLKLRVLRSHKHLSGRG